MDDDKVKLMKRLNKLFEIMKEYAPDDYYIVEILKEWIADEPELTEYSAYGILLAYKGILTEEMDCLLEFFDCYGIGVIYKKPCALGDRIRVDNWPTDRSVYWYHNPENEKTVNLGKLQECQAKILPADSYPLQFKLQSYYELEEKEDRLAFLYCREAEAETHFKLKKIDKLLREDGIEFEKSDLKVLMDCREKIIIEMGVLQGDLGLFWNFGEGTLSDVHQSLKWKWRSLRNGCMSTRDDLFDLFQGLENNTDEI
ncbi:hypothetical protein G9A89_023448 [Geosiphon pyriformis]|nr:hypothetical protein G9A89_023448 [Geosiphon pyriformis]